VYGAVRSKSEPVRLHRIKANTRTISKDPKTPTRKDKEVQQKDPGLRPEGEDLLNGWIEMGTAKYPGQSLTDPKIVLVFMTKTMTDIFLKTRPRKDRLQEVAGHQDLKYKDIENESPISPNRWNIGYIKL